MMIPSWNDIFLDVPTPGDDNNLVGLSNLDTRILRRHVQTSNTLNNPKLINPLPFLHKSVKILYPVSGYSY